MPKALQTSFLTNDQILQKIEGFYKPTASKFAEISQHWNKFEEYADGKQWSVKKDKQSLIAYQKSSTDTINNLPSEAVWNLPDVQGVFGENRSKQKLPKRTVNEIFPTIESSNAMVASLSPMPVYYPPDSNNEKQRELARKMNLFLESLFVGKPQKDFKRVHKEIDQFGHGFMFIHNDGKADKGHIPFFLDKEYAKFIQADYNVDDWSKVKWVIRQYKIYGYECKREFKLEIELNDFSEVEMEEIWIRQDVLYNDGDPNKWEKITRRKGQKEILKHAGRKIMELPDGDKIKKEEVDTAYPCLPIEAFRMRENNNMWIGESLVKHMIESQDIINKRASQEDFKVGYDVMPAVTVDSTTDTKLKANPHHIFLYPNERYPQGNGSRISPVAPISGPQVDVSLLHFSIDKARGDIARLTGISDAMRGGNPKGVYGAGHWREIMDAGMTKIKNAFSLIEQSFINMVNKIAKWALDDLEIRKYYEVYDCVTEKTVKITKEDFLAVKAYGVRIDTQDAKLLSIGEQLNKLKEFRQYNPDMDGREFIVAAANTLPGLFSAQYIDQLNKELDINREVKLLQLESEKLKLSLSQKQTDLENAKMDLEFERINMERQNMINGTPSGGGGPTPPAAAPLSEEPPMPPMEQPIEPQMPPMPPMEEQPMEEPMSPILQEYMDNALMVAEQAGEDPEEIRQGIMDLLQQIIEQNPNITDEQIIEILSQPE